MTTPQEEAVKLADKLASQICQLTGCSNAYSDVIASGILLELNLESLIADKRAHFEEAINIIRSSCSMCGGNGFTVGVESGHACDGTPEMCERMCPVPVQTQIECEYCGRPMAAIDKAIEKEDKV